MKPRPITPICDFESVAPEDILSGLTTLTGISGHGVFISPPESGPDKPLNWAIQEVINARNVLTEEERERLCTNAVLNSRRALACLVDWYVERDMLNRCKKPPSDARRKAQLLVSRGIIDELSSQVLERSIAKRNVTEHSYTVPSLDTAEDVVELMRLTISTARSRSDPSFGSWIFGTFLHSLGFSKKGRFAEFHGWSRPLLILWRFSPRPWVGILLPENATNAAVRRVFLDEIAPEQLIEILATAEHRFGRSSSASDIQSCELLGKKMSLAES